MFSMFSDSGTWAGAIRTHHVHLKPIYYDIFTEREYDIDSPDYHVFPYYYYGGP